MKGPANELFGTLASERTNREERATVESDAGLRRVGFVSAEAVLVGREREDCY